MELDILSALLASREAHDSITKYIEPKSYTREFQYLLRYISEYYARDNEANAVRLSVILEQIKATVDNDKHIARFQEMLERAVGTTTSIENTEAVILLAKKRELEIELASALAEGETDDVDDLLERYQSVRAATTIEELESEGEQVLENINVADVLAARADRSNLLPLFPRTINDHVDGGVERGDNIVLFGPTEIGKSLLSIHNACGWANMGKRVLYMINEDRIDRIATRIASNLTGMTRADMERYPEKATELAKQRGIDNIILVQITPGSKRSIDHLLEKYKPDAAILDQMRNVDVGGGKNANRVVQLEDIANFTRNMGKKHGVTMLNVTQAGDSARVKRFLDTGDVDFSNVGIPAQADLMIGFGADEEMIRRNERGISLCKNKISGDHATIIIGINPFLSRATSYDS
jgi:hypothetical protein